LFTKRLLLGKLSLRALQVRCIGVHHRPAHRLDLQLLLIALVVDFRELGSRRERLQSREIRLGIHVAQRAPASISCPDWKWMAVMTPGTSGAMSAPRTARNVPTAWNSPASRRIRLAVETVCGGWVVFGGIFAVQLFAKPYMMRNIHSDRVIPPQTVSTAKAGFSDWQGEFQAVGTLRAVRGADIAPRGARCHHRHPLPVRAGDRGRRAAGATECRVGISRDCSRSRRLPSSAEVNYQRDQKQLEIQAVSRAVVDADAANLKSAKAQLAEQQALVNKKLVRAPYAGRIGIAPGGHRPVRDREPSS